ncbi:MAG: molybdenum cofactor biosynthesis protein MoaB [Nitrospirae bacterium]|nr:molybdenum cofactor biosynthesis protein MoaB [Nitrospirota bacterium]
MSFEKHRSRTIPSVQCALLTVSDTRTKGDDESGQLIMEILKASAHTILSYELVKDDPAEIEKKLMDQALNRLIQAIIINGGTGISNRDQTFEAVERLLEKRLDGFGELFRSISYQEIGSPAMLTRAIAGTIQGKVIFSIPGSVNAVRLAMEKLIIPEIGHIVALLDL